MNSDIFKIGQIIVLQKNEIAHSTNTKKAQELLILTKRELNYLVACLLQTSPKDASNFTQKVGKLLITKLGSLGATASSATFAWIGGLIGGGMVTSSIVTGGLGLALGFGAYKMLSSKAKEYGKLTPLERNFVDKCIILVRFIDEWLEKQETIRAKDLQKFSKNSLEPLLVALLEHKSELESTLDIKNKLMFQAKALRNLKSLCEKYNNFDKPIERNPMFSAITDKLGSLKIKNPKEFVQDKIREKAISNAKERLMHNQLTPEELGLDKFEVIVQEEEQKINDKIKNMSLVSILAFLGLDHLLG